MKVRYKIFDSIEEINEFANAEDIIGIETLNNSNDPIKFRVWFRVPR